ncbi:MAG TPA: transcriptional regulator [Alphaproteobacteria bacterium]|nr:transcriptional regulator [Alphaproteobacteria bacterium]|tara:strand:- start:33 stop:512 length:480 start_codon:yes stop_codon:yes gene_type:complete
MKIRDIITPEDIVIRESADSKKQILQEMVRLVSARNMPLDERLVTESLLERERLGSTGLGDGVAIPHARCAFPEQTDRSITSLLLKLNKPIDFEANDNQPVDIIFMLLASQHCGTEHLTRLAAISRFIRDANAAEQIRKAASPDDIWQTLCDIRLSSAA